MFMGSGGLVLHTVPKILPQNFGAAVSAAPTQIEAGKITLE